MRKKQGLFEDYYSWNITSKMLSDAYGQMMSDQAQPLQVGFYLKYSLKQLKGLNVEVAYLTYFYFCFTLSLYFVVVQLLSRV